MPSCRQGSAGWLLHYTCTQTLRPTSQRMLPLQEPAGASSTASVALSWQAASELPGQEAICSRVSVNLGRAYLAHAPGFATVCRSFLSPQQPQPPVPVGLAREQVTAPWDLCLLSGLPKNTLCNL